MRTPKQMMSHIVSENIIYMSPFPSLEIPKMNGFRPNTDSSSTIITIGGYSLLESSLHPAPVSLWLDFCYKEKKKRNQSVGNNARNNRTDIALFYFTRSTVIYCATNFMFSSHKLSRKYRYLNTNGEFYFEMIPVQNVLWSTWSTSCVRCVQSSFIRHSPSHAPIFNLRQAMNLTRMTQLFRNKLMTQLIHLLRPNNNNKESHSNDNSDSDSNISRMSSLYYSIIERVFQIDGECIVIRLSTLINRKEDKVFPCNNKKEELI